MTKRLLALLMTLVMLLSLFPTAAIAEDDEGEEPRAAEDGDFCGETDDMPEEPDDTPEEPGEVEIPDALAFTLQPEDGEIPAEGSCIVFWELSFLPDWQELLLEETDENGDPQLSPVEELPAEARSFEIKAEGTYRLRAWLGEDSVLSEGFTVVFAPEEGATELSGEEADSAPEALAEGDMEGEASEALPTEDETDAQTPPADLNLSTGSCGENLRWTLDGSGTLTISGAGEMADWTGNESAWNPAPWYNKAYDITAVVIQNGVTSIGDSAFSGCYNLTSVVIPDSVTRIGNAAFSSCNSLSGLTLPGNLQSIGSDAFSYCVNLMSLVIPGSVTGIGAWAFNACTSLTDLYYEGTVAAWQELDCVNAFNRFRVTVHCSDGNLLPRDSSACGDNLTWTLDEGGTLTISGDGDMWDFGYTEAPWGQGPRIVSVVIRDGVTNIGSFAFCNCYQMTSVSIPDSVTSIGSCAFSACSSLSSIAIPDSVTSIGSSAFSACSSLSSIVIPESMTSIGNGAFRDCYTLTSVEIPEGVTGIGNDAFSDCHSLAVVDFPSTLTSIGDRAFYNCDIYSLRIPEGVTKIGGSAFGNNYHLNTVIFPSTLTSIGNSAFYNCQELTCVEIPEGVTSIGSYAFGCCYGLNSVTIPASVTSIGGRAFDPCGSLTEISFGGTVADWEAINGSAAIPRYTVTVHCSDGDVAPASVSDCGDHVTWTLTEGGTLILSGTGDMWDYTWDQRAPWAAQASSIQALVINNGVTSVGSYAFSETALSSVRISATVKSIGVYAFGGCGSLESVTIPESVTSISPGAFYSCSSLQEIRFEGPAPSMGEDSFGYVSAAAYYHYNDPSWTEEVRQSCGGNVIWYPVSTAPVVESIQNSYDGLTWTLYADGLLEVSGSGDMKTSSPYTFRGRYQAVIIREGVTSINYNAFSSNPNLLSVSIPNSVSLIRSNAFRDCSALTSITIPAGVSSIESGAFSSCIGLKQIYVASGNGSYSDIDGVLFNKDQTTLLCFPAGRSGAYRVPSGAVTIGSTAFLGCFDLRSVTIPSSVSNLTPAAFSGCVGLTEIHVDGRGAYLDIDGVLFDGNNPILIFCPPGRSGEYQVPDGIAVISDMAFSNCSKLSRIVLPDSVSSIGNRAFFRCTGLRGLTLPSGITSIGESAFSGCVGLSSLSLPAGLTSLGYDAFDGCSGLKSISIPAGVNAINSSNSYAGMFYGCSSLTTVQVDPNNQSFADIDGVLFNKAKTSLLYFPSARSGCYTVPQGTEIIAGYAFYNCAVSSIVFPAGIQKLESNSIRIGYSHPIKLRFLGGAPTFSGDCFGYGCDCEILYPAGDESWQGAQQQLNSYGITWTPYSGDGLRSGVCGPELRWTLDLDGALSIFGSGEMDDYGTTYYGYGNSPFLTAAYLIVEEGVESIGTYAFAGAGSLLEIQLPGSLRRIGSDAFYGCDGLTELRIPEGLQEIGDYAFSDCDSLTAAMLPASLTSLSQSCFSRCYALQEISFGGTVAQWKALGGAGLDPYTVTVRCSDGDILPAAQNRCGEDLTWTLEDGVLTISGSGYMWDFRSGINFAASYGEFWCSAPWFSRRQEIRSVVVGEGVRSIGSCAFWGGSAMNADGGTGASPWLQSVSLPSTLERIGNAAFQDCSGITEMTLPEGLQSIGNGVFFEASALRSITIPSTVREIGTAPFQFCFGLQEIRLSEDNVHFSFQGGVLYDLDQGRVIQCLYNQSGQVVIPEGIKSVGQSAFRNANIRSVVFPASFEYIDSGAFTFCGSLSELRFLGSAPGLHIDSSYNNMNDCFSDVTAAIRYPGGDPSWTKEVRAAFDVGKIQYGTPQFTWIPVYDEEIVGFGVCGDDLTWILYGDGVLRIYGSGAMFDYESGGAPWQSNRAQIRFVRAEDGVGSIGSCAFQGCSALEAMDLADSIQSIGASAFSDCSSLEEAVLPSGLGALADNLFTNCSKLRRVSIPSGVSSIGLYCFSGCSALENPVLPASLTSIGSYAFRYCRGITELALPEGLRSIGANAFYGCTGLTEAVLPENLSSLGLGVFHDCSGLTRVELPAGLTALPNYSFDGCSALAEIRLPEGLTSIGNYAFNGCVALHTFTVPDNVTKLGSSSFRGCSNLRQIVFPAALTQINAYSFYGCGALADVIYAGTEEQQAAISIGENNEPLLNAAWHCGKTGADTVPVTVESEGHGDLTVGLVFRGDRLYIQPQPEEGYMLETLTVNGVPYLAESYTVGQEESLTIHATFRPEEALLGTGACGAQLRWNLYEGGELVIYGLGKMYNYDPPSGCSWGGNLERIRSVSIRSGVTGIGHFAFYSGGSSLNIQSIQIPASLRTVGVGNYLRNLKAIDLEDLRSWLELGPSTDGYYGGDFDLTGELYLNGEPLTELTVPEGITSIRGSAFSGCKRLRSVVIPEGVTRVGASAFSGCSSLRSITLPTSLSSFGSYAFSDCNAIQEVHIQDLRWWLELSGSGDSCFPVGQLYLNGQLLEHAEIPADIRVLRDSVFEGCGRLRSVSLPEGLTAIGDRAFYNCSLLTELEIPSTVRSLGVSAFAGCNRITRAVIPQGVKEIPEYCFSNCRSLTELSIPGSVGSIGYCAFQYCRSLTELTIPESVTSLGWQAFCDCEALESVTLPTSLVSVGNWAFGECDAMKRLYIEDLRWWLELSVDSYGNLPSQAEVYVQGVLQEEITVPAGIDELRDYAFYGFRSLRRLDIPAGVVRVGEYALVGFDLDLVVFHGEAPAFCDNSLKSMKIQILYPADQPGWTEEVLQDYGGVEVTWIPYRGDAQPIAIAFDANGGEGAPDTAYKGKGFPRALPETAPTRQGYDFAGWALDPGAETAAYQPGDLYPDDADATLYALWTPWVFPVRYLSVRQAVVPEEQSKTWGEDLILSEEPALAMGCEFLGWSLIRGSAVPEYLPGDVFSEDPEERDAVIELYAVWQMKNYVISYQPNGGDEAPPAQIKIHGRPVTLSEMIPVRSGYRFLGWARDRMAAEAEFRAGDLYTLNEDAVLYAVWEDLNPTVPTESVLRLSDAESAAGREFTVDLSLDVNPGIMMLSFKLDYDESVLEFLGGQDGALSGWLFLPARNSVSWDAERDHTETGVLVTLRFRVREDAEPGSTEIRITELFAGNYNEEELTLGTAPAAVSISRRMAGDVTGDGKVNGIDLIRLRKYLAGDDVEINFSNADVNGDGKISGLDLIRLRKYLAGDDVILN